MPLADVLRPVLRGMRPAKQDAIDRVRRVWGTVVGDATARKSRLVSCRDGELLVEVPSAALRQHLSVFRREEVLAALQKRLPDLSIQSLKFRVSGGF